MKEMLGIRVAGGAHPGIDPRADKGDFATALSADMALFVAACGTGGRSGGDVAAKIAVESVLATMMNAFMERAPVDPDTPRDVLLDALSRANLSVRLQDPGRGMATDLIAAIVLPGRAWIARAGAACAFRLRAGQLLRLDATREVVACSRPLGSADAVDADVHWAPLMAGDALVLSTAGLTAAVPEAEIAEILGAHADVEAAAAALLERARELGGPCFAVIAARVGGE